MTDKRADVPLCSVGVEEDDGILGGPGRSKHCKCFLVVLKFTFPMFIHSLLVSFGHPVTIPFPPHRKEAPPQPRTRLLLSSWWYRRHCFGHGVAKITPNKDYDAKTLMLCVPPLDTRGILNGGLIRLSAASAKPARSY